jgi:hypothetical protein
VPGSYGFSVNCKHSSFGFLLLLLVTPLVMPFVVCKGFFFYIYAFSFLLSMHQNGTIKELNKIKASKER